MKVTPEQTEQETIRQAMSLLGKRTSELKRTKAIENLLKGGGKPRKPLAQLACTCGVDSGDSMTLEGHKASCPRGRAIKRRTSAASASQPAK